MKYRISIKNASRNDARELMYEEYTSRKKAQEVADKINQIQPSREAKVIMRELKLALERTKIVDDKKLEIYKIGRYTVKKITYKDGSFRVGVSEGVADYLPTIYERDDMEGNVIGFEIQTTSYGALSAEEIKEMAADLEEAAEVAEILTAEFVK